MIYNQVTSGNRKLIVFFNGYGFDESSVSHLDPAGFDVIVISDYRKFDFDFEQFDFSKYNQKYLISWSMGVYVSNLFKDIFEKFDKKIAINGTLRMIDDEFGIAKRIFSLTLKKFSPETNEKFAQNMFDENSKIFLRPKRNWEELKTELEALNELKVEDNLHFDKAFISTRDKIVPAKNQLNYWLNRTSIELLDAPHYPFDKFKSWGELL